MKNYYHVEYKVYRDGKSRAVLPTELEALEYLKKSALRHEVDPIRGTADRWN